MAVIGIDMDGVVADFVGASIIKAKELWNIDISYEEFTRPRTGKLIAEKVFSHPTQKQIEEVYHSIATEGTFENLPLLSGAYDAVKELNKDNAILFVTKALEWEFCPGEKKEWLGQNFPDINYKLVVVDMMETKSYLNLDFMIEDDPRTILALKYPVGIVVEQPWNKSFLQNNPEYFRVKSISEAPQLIHHIKNNLFCF
jgi:5'(3')-deoxyribonucleotidase